MRQRPNFMSTYRGLTLSYLVGAFSVIVKLKCSRRFVSSSRIQRPGRARDNGGSGASTVYRSEHLYLVSDTLCPGGWRGGGEDTPSWTRCSPYITNVTITSPAHSHNIISTNIFWKCLPIRYCLEQWKYSAMFAERWFSDSLG